MDADEVIRAIEQTDSENIQDVIDAVMKRYQILFPEWQVVFYSARREELEDPESIAMRIAGLLGGQKD